MAFLSMERNSPSLQGVKKRLSQNAQEKPILILHVAGLEPDFYLLTRLSLCMDCLVRMMGVFQQERELSWHLNGRPRTAVLISSGERKMLRSSGKPVSTTSKKPGKPSTLEYQRLRKEFRNTRSLGFGQRRGLAGISTKRHP